MPPLSLFSAREKAKPRPEPSRISALTKFASTRTLPTPTSAAKRRARPLTPLRAVRLKKPKRSSQVSFAHAACWPVLPGRAAHPAELLVILLGGAPQGFEFIVDVAIDVAPIGVAPRVMRRVFAHVMPCALARAGALLPFRLLLLLLLVALLQFVEDEGVGGVELDHRLVRAAACRDGAVWTRGDRRL